MRKIIISILAVILLSSPAIGQTMASEGAKVYFITPQNGAAVGKTFTVKFGLKGMGVAPAGVEKEKTGHHHLLINTKLEGEALQEPIISDESHRHFGGGQTEAEITLPVGTHTLQLVLGDHNHIPHKKPVMSEIITITVK